MVFTTTAITRTRFLSDHFNTTSNRIAGSCFVDDRRSEVENFEASLNENLSFTVRPPPLHSNGTSDLATKVLTHSITTNYFSHEVYNERWLLVA